MILAGDVGGTHTRLGLFDRNSSPLRPSRSAQYGTRDFPGIVEMTLDFLKKSDEKIEICCIGVAGPVVDGRSTPTNFPWTLDAAEISGALGAPTLLINDLEANAYGIAALEPSDLAIILRGLPCSHGNAAVISAGTGLGEAGLFWDGAVHRPFPCEGGHCTFAPRNTLEIQLLEFLLKRHQHVSWERVLSGPGLVNIYEFLRDSGRGDEPLWLAERLRSQDPSAAISEAAIHSESALCASALDLFVQLYGSEAGNLALKTMALGGVYLGGGIPPRILEILKQGTFGVAFQTKGRMKEMMERIPVFVILNDRAALFGAARCAVIHL
jgi:glucokinase